MPMYRLSDPAVGLLRYFNFSIGRKTRLGRKSAQEPRR